MTHYVYVLYSKQLNKYYIGNTVNVEERLSQHRDGYYKGAHTTRVSDWELYYSMNCEDKSQAIRIEQHIKRMKSRKYIENLKRYPEIAMKLRSSHAGSSR